MQRDVLQKILQAASGLTDKGGLTFDVPSEHKVTFYLGREGRSATVSEIEEIRLADGYVRLLARDPGEVYVEYGEISAVSVKPPKPDTKARAGFA